MQPLSAPVLVGAVGRLEQGVVHLIEDLAGSDRIERVHVVGDALVRKGAPNLRPSRPHWPWAASIGPTWALADGKHVMFLLRVQLTRPPLAEEDSVLRRIKHMCIDLLCLECAWRCARIDQDAVAGCCDHHCPCIPGACRRPGLKADRRVCLCKEGALWLWVLNVRTCGCRLIVNGLICLLCVCLTPKCCVRRILGQWCL